MVQDEEALSWLDEDDAHVAPRTQSRARKNAATAEAGATPGPDAVKGTANRELDDGLERGHERGHEHGGNHDHEHGDEDDFDEDDLDDAEPVGPSSTALVVLGVLAGVYFLYTLGWLSFAVRSAISVGTDPLADAMWNIGLWLAVLAAPLWFVLPFWLVKRVALRYGVLILGALVLIPIPLVWR